MKTMYPPGCDYNGFVAIYALEVEDFDLIVVIIVPFFTISIFMQDIANLIFFPQTFLCCKQRVFLNSFLNQF